MSARCPTPAARSCAPRITATLEPACRAFDALRRQVAHAAFDARVGVAGQISSPVGLPSSPSLQATSRHRPTLQHNRPGVILVHTLTEATGEDATTALDLLTAVEGALSD